MDGSEIELSETVFDRMDLTDEACFLCGTRLGADQTLEHVFPRWLQHRHDLWNQELTLLNGTSIRYSQITIPCCATCNNTNLSALENRIRTAVEAGYHESAKLSSHDLFQWIGKIFYGILRKELTLLLNRRDAGEGTIVTDEMLQGFATLHLFLQSIRQPFQFVDGEPFSVLVVNLHASDFHGDYFFRDCLKPMVCALRTNDIGFIITLQDAGIISESYSRYVEEVAGRKLLPIQFEELYAKCVYQMSLFTRTPQYAIATSKDASLPTTVHMLPIGGLSGKPIVDDWVQADYVDVLATILQQTFHDLNRNQLFPAPDQVMTWMSDTHGRAALFDADGHPISP